MARTDSNKVTKRFLRNTKDKRESSSKSDGINLGLGSSEYKEMIRDKKGLSEIEQEYEKLNEAGLRKDGEFTNVDESYEKRMEKLAAEPVARQVERDNKDNLRLSDAERVVSNQVVKSIEGEAIAARAAEQAAQTEGLEDDRFVKRRLPKMIEAEVYNEGVSKDDFYPGSSVLDKYM